VKSYLTVSEIAERLESSPGSVRRWIKQGKVKGYTSGGGQYRVKIDEFEKFEIALSKVSYIKADRDLSPEELSYLAGIVDGDGSIMIKKIKRKVSPDYRAHFKVTMVCEPLVRFVHETLGGRFVPCKNTNSNHRATFSVEMEGPRAEAALVKLLPYLKLKKEQAQVVLNFRELQSRSGDYKTKLIGYKTIMSSKHSAPFKTRNRALSDEYLQMCERLYQECKALKHMSVNNVVDTEKVSVLDIAYIAGLIDAEGCLSISQRRRKHVVYAYDAVISINMTDELPIKFITEKAGGTYSKQSFKGKRKSVYRYSIKCKSAEPVLALLIPYLIVKKEQAHLLLEFRNFQKTFPKDLKFRLGEPRQFTQSGKIIVRRYRVLSSEYLRMCNDFKQKCSALNKNG
jgi:excisionase family DNA binding protein